MCSITIFLWIKFRSIFSRASEYNFFATHIEIVMKFGPTNGFRFGFGIQLFQPYFRVLMFARFSAQYSFTFYLNVGTHMKWKAHFFQEIGFYIIRFSTLFMWNRLMLAGNSSLWFSCLSLICILGHESIQCVRMIKIHFLNVES